jgi:hypothetical protein
MTMKKLAAIDSSLESLTFIKKIIYTKFPFFKLLYKKLFTLKHIFLGICNIFVQITPSLYFHTTEYVKYFG